MTNTKKRNLVISVLTVILAGILALMGVIGLSTKTVKAERTDEYDLEYTFNGLAENGADYFNMEQKKLKEGQKLYGKLIIAYHDVTNAETTTARITISDGESEITFLFTASENGKCFVTSDKGLSIKAEKLTKLQESNSMYQVYSFYNGEFVIEKEGETTASRDTFGFSADWQIINIEGDIFYIEDLSFDLDEEQEDKPSEKPDEDIKEDNPTTTPDEDKKETEKKAHGVQIIGGGAILLAGIGFGLYMTKKRKN